MAVAIISTVISAIIGAFIGAYLQRRWTPDYSSELGGLRQQVASFQQRIETLELERAEWEHLALTVSLRQAVQGAYIMIEAVTLKRKDVELSPPHRPKPTDNWKIGPHLGTQIQWAPQRNPVDTLQMMEPDIRPGFPIDIDLVLGCRIRGRAGTIRRKRLVTVDFLNHSMTDFSG
jgi:hypothetical protein